MVGREEPQNVVKGNLVPDDLVLELLIRQLGRVLVRPSVAGDLVALGDHALQSLSVQTQTSSLRALLTLMKPGHGVE